MTGAAIAAGLGDDWIDVSDEVWLEGHFLTCDGHRNLYLLTFMNDLNAGLTIGESPDQSARYRSDRIGQLVSHLMRQVDGVSRSEHSGDQQLLISILLGDLDRRRVDHHSDQLLSPISRHRRRHHHSQQSPFLSIENADQSIRTTDGDLLPLWMPTERIDRSVEIDGGKHLDVPRVELLDFLLLRCIARSGDLFENPLHSLGKRSVKITAIDRHLAMTIEATSGGDTLPIAAVSQAEHSAGHRRKGPQQVRVVTDDALDLTVDSVDLRCPIRPTDQDLFLGRVAIDRRQPTLENRRCDRGDVVDESLRLHLCQLCSHVPSDGDHMASIEGEDSIESPVRGCSIEENLLTATGIDGPDRVVSAAKRNQLAIGGPAGAIHGVKGDRYRDR